MRCQLCIFDPEHCHLKYQYPLHPSNLIACFLILASSASIQMFIQVHTRAIRDDDDALCFFCGRLIMLSLCILPFSTGVLFASHNALHLGSLIVYVILVLLAVIGWGSICCTPLFAMLDDDI